MKFSFPTLKVDRATWGDDWPLTIERGTLQLRSGSRVVLIANGKVYAVNGLAKQERHILPWKGLRYRPIDEIWADDPGNPGLKKSIARLIATGLALPKTN